MEIMIIDHTNKRILTTMHEVEGKGSKLINTIAGRSFPDSYRLYTMSDLGSIHFNIETDVELKISQDILILEIVN